MTHRAAAWKTKPRKFPLGDAALDFEIIRDLGDFVAVLQRSLQHRGTLMICNGDPVSVATSVAPLLPPRAHVLSTDAAGTFFKLPWTRGSVTSNDSLLLNRKIFRPRVNHCASRMREDDSKKRQWIFLMVLKAGDGNVGECKLEMESRGLVIKGGW